MAGQGRRIIRALALASTIDLDFLTPRADRRNRRDLPEKRPIPRGPGGRTCPDSAKPPEIPLFRPFNRLLKKSIQDFFSHAKQKCDFCFASFFKHLRVRKMAVGPSTAPQGVEKRVFQQPANGP